jgi:hypothetical protein
MTPNERARDAAILEHIRRYHLTTPEILHRLFFPGVKINAVRQVIKRLFRQKRIHRATLYERRKYYLLTRRQAVRMGEDRRIGEKFEYQGLVNAFAILSFCAESGVTKFTPKEFAAAFPGCVIRGVRGANYYLDPYDTTEGRKHRLGFIHVDYGISTKTLIQRKIRPILSRPFTKPDFTQLVQDGNFVVCILTPTAEKAEEIRVALTAERTGYARFRIVVVPDLAELLTRRGKFKKNRPIPTGKERGKRKKKKQPGHAAEPAPADGEPTT